MRRSSESEWLVLVHQIPPKPAYLRVKIGRRLTRIGAVPLKNSVYLLPAFDSCQEDFQWVLREIKAEGGEATLLRSQLVEGLEDDQIRALFSAERERDYTELLRQARTLMSQLNAELASSNVSSSHALDSELTRLERRLETVVEHDFFGAVGREAVSAELAEARQRLSRPVNTADLTLEPIPSRLYQRRTWVTRERVHVDRIASAWLIRKYIDPQATFKFVPAKGYSAEPDEVCFDMFEAEFTHEGNRCTFEVLCSRFELRHAGLSAIAELVHDLDVKDDRYNRAETAGFFAQLEGATLLHAEDDARIAHGSALLEALLLYFASKERK
jgi:hypothetical protein